MGEAKEDAQFKAMSLYPGLHHFKKGVLFVMQWTGTEHQEMEKVFMGILVGVVNSKVLTLSSTSFITPSTNFIPQKPSKNLKNA